MKQSQEVRDALLNYRRMVTPESSTTRKWLRTWGERILVVLRMRNVHSEADTAVWLPKEHVLFPAPPRFQTVLITPALL